MCTHAVYQTAGPDRLSPTRTEPSDGLNCSEGHSGLAPCGDTGIGRLDAQPARVSSKRIIHLHVGLLQLAAKRFRPKTTGYFVISRKKTTQRLKFTYLS